MHQERDAGAAVSAVILRTHESGPAYRRPGRYGGELAEPPSSSIFPAWISRLKWTIRILRPANGAGLSMTTGHDFGFLGLAIPAGFPAHDVDEAGMARIRGNIALTSLCSISYGKDFGSSVVARLMVLASSSGESKSGFLSQPLFNLGEFRCQRISPNRGKLCASGTSWMPTGKRSGAWLHRWRASSWAKRIRGIRRFSIP